MRIYRTKSQRNALRVAHAYLKTGRNVRLARKHGIWEVKIYARRYG